MRLHKCAATGCRDQIPLRFLMCPACWRRVPAVAQVEVYAAWNHGKGLDSDEYLQAVAKAVELVGPRALVASGALARPWGRLHRARA